MDSGIKYSEKDLYSLKVKYNELLERNKKAEVFFKANSISECIKYLDLFNDVTRQLSGIIFFIEFLSGEELSYEQKINGFNEVKE
ncbi:hypothetical protein AXY43_13440 [Clostridium sp. MF28]|uniref:hypothetical protein n=1 Tax=Clostridium TaxID=1485 RepID=UPI000CF8506D|nr:MULTISPECIES: hypothetical protein [Clostridium]AVK48947.1 hypothetical protein AXY43_13440 [Clostridium sp. MF28]PSM56490.1 hypothetical protein C4L39_17425 [Clostridium diolis]